MWGLRFKGLESGLSYRKEINFLLMFVVCFGLIFVPLCEFSTLVCCVFVFPPHTLSCTSLWYLVVLLNHDTHNMTHTRRDTHKTHMRTLTFETRT